MNAIVLSFTEYGYNLMKGIDFSEIENDLQFNDDNKTILVKNYFDPSKSVDNGTLLLAIITEKIVADGLEDQTTVNDYGKELYSLYDSIVDQFDLNK